MDLRMVGVWGLVVGIRGGRGQGSRWWGLTPSDPRPLTPLTLGLGDGVRSEGV